MKMLMLSLLFVLSSVGVNAFAGHDVVHSDSVSLNFKKTDYSFVISWVEGPKKGGSRFVMKTWKKDVGTMNGPYQSLDKNLNIVLWMPTMGHGSAPVKITNLGDGEYDVSNVQFIMGGKWEIKFQLKDGAQIFDETIVSLSI